jgi:CheY-like chemotaxis protein
VDKNTLLSRWYIIAKNYLCQTFFVVHLLIFVKTPLMPTSGPVIIVEDDADDYELIELAFKSLGVTNEIVFFPNGEKALDYLLNTPRNPFIILCDVNMPGMDGFELREAINENDYLKKKAVPFIFLSTSDRVSDINKAYTLTVQGYFTKPDSLAGLTNELKAIVDYWRKCKHPSKN